MERYFKKLYKEFLVFFKKYYVHDIGMSFGVDKLRLDKKTKNEFFDNYEKQSFLSFLQDVKSIVYSETVFDFIIEKSKTDWALWYLLEFLEKKRIIQVTKKGKAVLLKKELLKTIPAPKKEEEIKARIEKALKTKVKNKEPVIKLFEKFKKFTVKAELDQMPISQGSAIFIVKEILSIVPLKKSFLFVGDDDFVSVILALADPGIECVVCDADLQLLSCINSLAKRFHLKIKTKQVDFRKKKPLKDRFVGFLSSPVYTFEGIKSFVDYGLKQLGKEGGKIFLDLGDEAMGNRYLFLQEFFSKKNLIIERIIPKKIIYPWISLHKEDKVITKRMLSFFDKKTLEKSPKIGGSLYILTYLPFKVKRPKLKKSIYSYI